MSRQYKILLTVLLTSGVSHLSFADQTVGNRGYVTNTPPFQVSVDGMPLEVSAVPAAADLTRQKDIKLQEDHIQVRFDGFETTPVLNVIAFPDGAVRGEEVNFMPYSNYNAFIKKAELRIFPVGESLQKEPMAVIDVNDAVDEAVTWKAPEHFKIEAVNYILRVYDKHGRFDETEPKLLHLLDTDKPVGNEEDKKRELLIGYGENHRFIKNIRVSGGGITVNGDKLAPDSTVWVMGRTVPVDAKGKFAYRQIVPSGHQTVDIVTQTGDIRTELNRDVDIPRNDWFYVGMADLTVGKSSIHGPETLVTGEDTSEYKGKIYTEGQLAFYARGKINNDWLLTTSADTEEQPVNDLFSNFSSKNPQYLLLRIDPESYYPVYGDDSTIVEDAPTEGKFYIRLQNQDSQIMWGNFKTEITGTDLMNYHRTLYGGNLLYKSPGTTKYGEKRIEVNGFAADPGSLGALEEFRGTGGSLYYLRNQDLVVGSEQLRIEVRDQDSGIVLGSQNLVYGQDYQIDYIQGRVILTQPLSSTASANTIVSTSSLSGNPTYLVANYEYTPDVTEVSNLTKGGRVSAWLNDNFRVGATAYSQGGVDDNQLLLGADTTLRYKPGTYLKFEKAYSNGPGDQSMTSQDGGFDFNAIPQTVSHNQRADAYRAETALDLSEISNGAVSGKLDAYILDRENGFSAPGELTDEGIKQEGITAELPVNKNLELNEKFDDKEGSDTGVLKSNEASVAYKVNPADTVSLAVRTDDQESALAGGTSEILSQTGNRTDAAVKIDHAPLNAKGEKGPYDVYVLGQATLDKDATRSSNNRGGVGGSYDLNKRITLTGEATDGNEGIGGKAGVEYRASDRTSYYTNYLVDTERSDIGYSGRNSTWTTGVKSRYTDSLSVFGEEKYQSADNGPAGLLHSYGLDLAASDKWTYGARIERGTLSDPVNGDDQRTAVSLSTGYHNDKTKYATTLEWRGDDSNLDGKRSSWLMKNSFAYQTTPDWRFLGNADFAISNDSDLSTDPDTNYVKLSTGYAYRPVNNDRLNMLFKYEYLDDASSPGQESATTIDAASDYKQQSHVIDIDADYDLTSKLTVGGKFGFRLGELEDTTVDDPQWFADQAWLAVVRVDYHVVKEWDLTAEFHCLDAQEAGDANYGALIGVYRRINKNTKVGVGYNFSDFSDDMTNLDYKSRGFYFDVLGEF